MKLLLAALQLIAQIRSYLPYKGVPCISIPGDRRGLETRNHNLHLYRLAVALVQTGGRTWKPAKKTFIAAASALSAGTFEFEVARELKRSRVTGPPSSVCISIVPFDQYD
jgi:hypothetical protein